MEDDISAVTRRMSVSRELLKAAVESYIEVCRQRIDMYAGQHESFASRREVHRLTRALKHLRALEEIRRQSN